MTEDKNASVSNYLRAMSFESPDWIPCNVSIMPATWIRYGEAVEEVVLEHPRLFPDYRAGMFRSTVLHRQYSSGRWTDAWGTPWENIRDGLDSIPVEEEAPLRNWEALAAYTPPDPLKVTDLGDPIDWNERSRLVQETKSRGGLARGGLCHGFMFMRLYYLRGFTNLMVDFAMRDPRLDDLISLVRDFNIELVRSWLKIGVELMHGGDDMGMQTSLPVSPQAWRHYIGPCYASIVGECRDNGVPFHLHSDGHIVEIIPDLIDCGVSIINPQVRANGLENLREVAKGRVCIDLDLDRQLFPFSEPGEIREHIQSAIETLNTPRGGLMLHAECEPDVPLENIRSIVETLELSGCGPK